MKKIISISCFVFYHIILHAQWGDAGNCHNNANTQDNWAVGRSSVINSTFKFVANYGCSGTLINRNTDDNNLGFYFIIARHCLSTNGNNNDNYIDFNATYKFMFNYQSPDGNTNSTASTNKGILSQQIQSNDISDQGYEYLHYSKIRKVADYFWGDFALCEILTPLPPHFKVNYAGWNPSAFYGSTLVNSTPPPCFLPNEFINVHHPSGDIKKISGTNKVQNLTQPIAVGCYTITTIIDILFGWIWGNQYSTQVICNYVDNPWYAVPTWCNGSIEGGSSGSGLFNVNNKLIGVMSFGLDCAPGAHGYGKLRSNYSHTNVKNTLNPSNELLIDLIGMDGRTINCYDNLDLPGVIATPPVSGEYFPANHYQQGNYVELRTQGYISTNAPIRVYSGADYALLAGTKITLGSGFKVEAGAKFVAAIAPCTKQMQANNPSEVSYKDLLSMVEIPKSKEFNINEHKQITSIESSVNIIPNPNNGTFQITVLKDHKPATIKEIKVLDLFGKVIWEIGASTKSVYDIDISSYSQGIYYLRVINETGEIQTKKIVKY